MRTVLVAALCTFALAGCGSPDADADGDGEITMEEAAAKTEELVKPQPGQWRVTAELVELDMPGAPAEVQEMMRGMMDQGAQTTEYCLTPEEAERGFEEMLKEGQAQENCTFEKFEADGGDIDAVMLCEGSGQGQPTARMAITGTGSETSSSMNMTMEASGPNGQAMNMVMKSTQERIGDCPAS